MLRCVCVCVCVWLISLAALIFPPSLAAVTMRVDEVAVGEVIAVNGVKFVKIGHDAVKGSRFIVREQVPICAFGATGTMQEFSLAQCLALPTPGAIGYTPGPCLADERDGKLYEIRKFADGNCWMADNLMYGGAVDSCVGMTEVGYTDVAYGGSDGMAAPSDRFGPGTYGNCRDPRVGCVAGSLENTKCVCTPGSTQCGYLYNWQAAVQLPSAYAGNYVSYPNGVPSTTNHLQGICPDGWHLPAGNETTWLSEFATLDMANGGTGAYQSPCTTASCNFWRPGYSYKGVYTGRTWVGGWLDYQGSTLYQWSAGEYSKSDAMRLFAKKIEVELDAHYLKNYGMTVRCVKDTPEMMQDFTPADCAVHPTPAAGHTAVGHLKDERDGMIYEIRKLADGRCWMADELADGGACPPGWQLPAGETRCVKDTLERTMQDFTTADCSAYPTPVAAGYTSIGYLRDERDGKWYEVRKFADGKCWMVDNLRYGGDSDHCVGAGTASYFNSDYGLADGMTAPSDRFGEGTYGNCYDPRIGYIAGELENLERVCTPGSTSCGYLYNWQAVMQLPTAKYNTAVVYPGGTPSTSNFHRGICPTGWHVPSGGTNKATSEFAQLDMANGGTGANRLACTTTACDFWRPGNSYKGVYTGRVNGYGMLAYQGRNYHLWSASEINAVESWRMLANNSNDVYPGDARYNKYYGMAVRCVKD